MYKYTLVSPDKREELLFATQEGVFLPTGTSELLIEAGRQVRHCPGKVLDLGCGCGLTGLVLARAGLCNGPLFASDISEAAIALARENAGAMGVDYVARQGSLFDPWPGEKFDLIIDDIAGISEEIARISPWYPPPVACDAGRDGSRWVAQVIELSRDHLAEGGTLIFPLLSLSDEDKILGTLRNTYTRYSMITKKDWFLPEEIESRSDVWLPLLQEGAIRCQKKYGKWIWSTSVYGAHN